jgi:IS5 family transposase
MPVRQVGQGRLAEVWLRPEAGIGRNVRLERIHGLVTWYRLEQILEKLRSAKTGRPAYPPLVLLKVLLLQSWHTLSDIGIEEALLDRISFRRFCGFGLDDTTPDATTIRCDLAEAGLAEKVFREIAGQLDKQGLVLKQGTLIEATLVEADARRPPMSEGEVSGRDPDAGFTRRGQRSFFGFKAHIAVDQGSDLIRDCVLTGADIGDSLACDGLVQGDEAIVYADKAYDMQARREALAEAGIRSGLMHRRHPRRRSPPWQKWMNVALTPIRCQVERLFGLMKRSYGYRRVRYLGLNRNRSHLYLICAAINLRRAVNLTP